jgi:hypothetical protein
MTPELPIGYGFSPGEPPSDEPNRREVMTVSLWVSADGSLRIVRRDREPRYMCLGADELDRLMLLRRLAVRATRRLERGRPLPGMRAQAVVLYAPIEGLYSNADNHLYYTALSPSDPRPDHSLRRLITYMHVLFDRRHDRSEALGDGKEECQIAEN